MREIIETYIIVTSILINNLILASLRQETHLENSLILARVQLIQMSSNDIPSSRLKDNQIHAKIHSRTF